MRAVYEIMHKDRSVASIDTAGRARVCYPSFMPYGLSFKNSEDIDTLIQNITNFHHWCALRVLPLDRKHAKAILNSAGLTQATTDKARAEIALT